MIDPESMVQVPAAPAFNFLVGTPLSSCRLTAPADS
jgi:hypothetical protein